MLGLNHIKLTFQTIQTNSILYLLKSCNVNKAAGVNNVSNKFLEDGVDVLANIQTILFSKRLRCRKAETSAQKRV